MNKNNATRRKTSWKENTVWNRRGVCCLPPSGTTILSPHVPRVPFGHPGLFKFSPIRGKIFKARPSASSSASASVWALALWLFVFAGIARSQPASPAVPAAPASDARTPTLAREPFITLPSGWETLPARLRERHVRERDNEYSIFRMTSRDLVPRILDAARALDRLPRVRRNENPRESAALIHEAAEQLLYRAALMDPPLPQPTLFALLRLEALAQALVECCEEKSYGTARLLARQAQRQTRELAAQLPEDFLEAIPWQPRRLPLTETEGAR